MIIIGLCGSSGSGKGYVGDLFLKYGVARIDTDRVYREVCLLSEPCIRELTDYFGKGILVNGRVDKRALANMVFEGEGSFERLNKLNEITHKYIRKETDALIERYEKEGAKAVLVDAPVLFESGFDKMCHYTICVLSPIEEKIQRIISRDKITREKAFARLSSQMSEKELLEKCTYAIDHSGKKDVDSQVISILKDLNIGKV